jgi:hypothetical protein
MSPLLDGATGVDGGGRIALVLLGTERDDALGGVVAGTSGVCFGDVDDGAAVGAAVRWAGAVVLRGAVASLCSDAAVSGVDDVPLPVSPGVGDALVVDIDAAPAAEWEGVTVCDVTADTRGAAAGSVPPVQPATEMAITAPSAAVMFSRRARRLDC